MLNAECSVHFALDILHFEVNADGPLPPKGGSHTRKIHYCEGSAKSVTVVPEPMMTCCRPPSM